MKSIIINIALCSIFLSSMTVVYAQVAAVRVTVKVPEAGVGEKGVYIAGSFNNWNAGDSLYKMHEEGNGLYSIILPVFDSKKYEYKYTLGNWNKVEVALNDSEIHNRFFISSNEKKIVDTVLRWKQSSQAENNNNPQLQKFNTMKDSMLANIKPGLNNMLQLLKSYVQNLLQDKPNARVHKRLDKKSEKQLNEVYEQVTKLLWNVMAILTSEQKREIRDRLDKAGARDDFLNTFQGAFNATLQGNSVKTK